MHVKASARYVRVAPNKVRQVVAHIRGQRVEDARRVLQLSPKGAAGPVLKALDSAVANAENNHELDPADLWVTAAVVDEGPTLKRFQPRAMGRAYRIRKRTSHITISVGTENAPPPRVDRQKESVLARRTAPAAASEQGANEDTSTAAEPSTAAKQGE